MKKIIVIGGGPAGMMAAEAAAEQGADVLLIEQNSILGRKLLITGKGRCNVTNFCDENELISQVVTNPKFLYSAFSSFNAYDAYAYFEEAGLALKIERGNRVFPVSDRATDVRNALQKRLNERGVAVVQDKILSISADPLCAKGEKRYYECDAMIIATGGVSYPATGSTGDGYKFAKMIGHKVAPATPSLVPLIGEKNLCASMAGLSLKNVELTIKNQKVIYQGFGEMLFTHEGISGPLVLSASSYLKEKDFPCTALIDLKPALDVQTLDKRICRDFEEYINRDFSNALDKLLPKKMIPQIISMSGIPAGVKVHQITREQRLNLVNIIKAFPIKLFNKSGFHEAIITSGGIDIREVDPRTMESKLIKNLYFAGEVLDVDALTGGYNLQIAYSTGRLAGRNAAKED